MKFKELKPGDFESTFNLLREAKLDSSDLKRANVRLFIMIEDNELAGVGGLEIINKVALLRSVAVSPNFQGKGVGTQLVNAIEETARKSGLTALYLLTNTAAGFFKANGYQVIHRDDFAESLKKTAQFSGLCPVSAVCMKKEMQ